MTFTRPAKENRRVVVTGIGIVSPLGNNLKEAWDSCINGKSGIAQIQSFDTENFGTTIAGEVKNFDVDKYVTKKDQKKMDRFIHLSLASTEEALLDSGVSVNETNSQRIGCVLGVGLGGLPYIEKQHTALMNRGPGRVSPFFIPATISNLATGQIAIKYGMEGPNYVVTSACASGAHSIGEAAKYIQSGQCDVMIAGGSESAIGPMSVAGFSSMKALSTRNDSPTTASRPFDIDRDGFVMAEGSATLVLEDYELAYKRGAKIYGEVVGYGLSCDAHHMTTPAPGGRGAALSMETAIRDAGIDHNQIDYVNAHGTSTPVGDIMETDAIKTVFGDHSSKLWVSSTKSMTGHTLGAAGAIESVFSLMAINSNVVPPTINLDTPSVGCDLDYVPGTAREKEVRYVMNNSFGFGGTNATLIFGAL
ncbi:MAG: beta-ketoacyl-ACP synthase II [Bdellovibrionales bacterium]